MGSEVNTLTKNDRRVLDAVAWAQDEFDGFAPHGSRDWTSIRRLLASGLVEDVGMGECQSCPEPHDVSIYVLAAAGREVRGGE